MAYVTWRDDDYRVTSYGNGLAYTVEETIRPAPNDHVVTLASYHVQGEDAAQWRADYTDAMGQGAMAVLVFHRDMMGEMGR